MCSCRVMGLACTDRQMEGLGHKNLKTDTKRKKEKEGKKDEKQY